jgi:cardiolipin synthase
MDVLQMLWETTIPQWAAVGLVAVNGLVGFVAVGVVPRNRPPGAAWGWILMIFLFPVLGVLAYLVLGRADLPEHRKDKQRRAPQLVDHDDPWAPETVQGAPEWVGEAVELNRTNAGFPPTRGNRLQIRTDYDATLDEMAQQIWAAESFVHCQFYITVADPTTEPVIAALEDAHTRGVVVRVLIDHLGSVGYPGYKDLVARLEVAGIPWRRMLPVRPWRGEYQRPDLRNHRKILVVDGTVAYTGSQNLIDRSYNKKSNRRHHLQWHDLMLRIQGPAVADLNAVFATDWYCETDERIPSDASSPTPEPVPGGVVVQVLPSGPGLVKQGNLQLFIHLFASANARITVCTAYFVPDESLLNALRTAVGRGVAVRLYVGSAPRTSVTYHAQCSYHEDLLRAGVRLFLYPSPHVLHSKFLLIDDRVAVVGSSNMDIRSFALAHEINLLIIDPGVVSDLGAVVGRYHSQCEELELGAWLARPWHRKYLDNAARLTSALQ